ncbi:MAG: DegT/DnrJ/EryC1/StrS family aminotransferase [Dehalococcoidia bacterium]
MKVPYVNLVEQHASIKDELLAAVATVIDHGQFILGDEVSEFERRFADISGSSYAVGVNSGTDALILALKALDIGPGDEVITVPNSFVSSASCIALLGARPIFVDVGEDYNIDAALIEPAITPNTRAILPVHLTGRPAPMGPIMELAKAHNLYVIEDCAQAVAAEYKGQRVGSFGTVGCFSLHPLKTLNACGDGGMLTTNDPGLYEQFKTLRNIGLKNRDECVAWSHNSRLDTLQAAILLVKLQHLEPWTEQRRNNACAYRSLLAGLSWVQTPADQEYERAVYHTFVIQADRRDQLRAYLAERGIGSAVHYPIPIHLQETAASLGYPPGSFPVAERQAGRILSLPVYPELTPSQIEYVADSLRSFYA